MRIFKYEPGTCGLTVADGFSPQIILPVKQLFGSVMRTYSLDDSTNNEHTLLRRSSILCGVMCKSKHLRQCISCGLQSLFDYQIAICFLASRSWHSWHICQFIINGKLHLLYFIISDLLLHIKYQIILTKLLIWIHKIIINSSYHFCQNSSAKLIRMVNNFNN